MPLCKPTCFFDLIRKKKFINLVKITTCLNDNSRLEYLEVGSKGINTRYFSLIKLVELPNCKKKILKCFQGTFFYACAVAITNYQKQFLSKKFY